MEDFHVAELAEVKGSELGLFAIYDGHLGDTVPAYLQKNLFSNILNEASFIHICFNMKVPQSLAFAAILFLSFHSRKNFGHIRTEHSQRLTKRQTRLSCHILQIWGQVAPLP